MEVNALYEGDCLEIMAEFPPCAFDLIVTSPPYNLKNTTGGGLTPGISRKWPRCKLAGGYDDYGDAMPHDKYVAWQRECVSAMLRVLKDDGAIFYNHKWRVQGGLLQDRQDIMAGFPVRQIIIWERAGSHNLNDGYFMPNYEVIYLIAKPAFKLRKRANGIGAVWKIKQERNNPHPAPFPVELARRCIHATDARLILDPFMGSGTTAIAAKSCRRDWVGIERNRKYCGMARKRISSYREQVDLFSGDLTGGV